MNGNPIDDLDSVHRNIPSMKVREACGFPADQAWTKYRHECGIPARVKFFTLYEAVTMFIRVDWRQVCRDVGHKKYIRVPTALILYQAAQKLFELGKQEYLLNRTRELDALITDDCSTWDEVLSKVSAKLGKPLSERTLSRMCDRLKLAKYSRKRLFLRKEESMLEQEATRPQR